MKSFGNILLIACYELGHQPLSLALPAAFLRRAGYAPAMVDTSVQSLEESAIQRARLVAIAVPMHTATRLGVQVAERVRRINPRAHIVFCGLYASLNAALLVPDKGDSILAGEFETELVALADRLEAETGTAQSNVSLARQDFPVPYRAALPELRHYAHFRIGDTRVPAGYVEATRGCLHTCLHCPITPVYGGRFVAIPRDVVLSDIRAQVEAGARHITFGDPDFLNGPRHSMAIVREMHAAFPDLTFDATIKIEHILEHHDLFPELEELGCAFVVSAVESFSEEVLGALAKGHKVADIKAALAVTREAGIVMRPTFVAFSPWTTLEDYLELLRQVELNAMVRQVDPVQYTIRLLIPPQSALLTAANRAAGWLGALDRHTYTYRWKHPDPRMDALHREVSTLVERAVQRGDAPAVIFEAVKTLAYRYAGQPLPGPAAHSLLPAPDIVPGLTESWFC